MSTEIGPKQFDIAGQIFLQIALFALLLFSVYILANPTWDYLIHESIILKWGFAFVILFLNVRNFFPLLFFPFWVIINEESKTLEFKYLMLSTKVVGVAEIISYNTTVIKLPKSRSEYCGIVLLLSKGKKILVSDLNLDNYTPVETFLNNLNFENAGGERFSFLSYYIYQ